MDLEKIFSEHNRKAKAFVKLQSEGVDISAATYKIFGNEVGDEMVKMRQSEIIIKENKN